MTAKEQAELALLARLGDREAANELTRSVWDWVYLKANRYARGSGGAYDADDLASIMFATMPYAIESYRAGRGSFLNYFAYAASRAASKHIKRQARHVRESMPFEEAYELPEDAGAAEQVEHLLRRLSPLDRAIVEGMTGLDGKRVPIRRLARRFGMKQSRLQERYEDLIEELRELSGVGV